MKQEYKDLKIIGVDETGVGDYFTPLVSCALFSTYENSLELEKMGVTDSKRLTDTKIKELAKEIKKIVKYNISHLSTKGYNKLNKQFNANELKMFVHMSTINQLEERVKADLIILDKFSNTESIKKYYRKLGENDYFDFKHFSTKLSLVEKGEMEHPNVAAASILARDFMLRKMEEKEKEYGMKFPLGTNTIVEETAQKFLKKYGKTKFLDVVKASFKTTKKIIGDQND